MKFQKIIVCIFNLTLATIVQGMQLILQNSNNSSSNIVTNSSLQIDIRDFVPPVLSNITVNPNLDKLDEKFAKCNGIDIREITISQIQHFYSQGNLSAVELTKCYLIRIDRMNPVLKAVIEINSQALEEASKLDEERKAGHIRSPVHGIPILVKDGIATGDGMENTAGSLALLGIRPKSDSEVVSHLRKAGAIILGKANLSEMYCFRGTNIPNGWSSRGGQTRSAYNLNKSPEGSSSGSAVSVSANLCVVSIATETDGSMLVPASSAGVFAIKPTFDLVSVKGVIPLSRNQDHIGPMARTVKDLSILLDAMVPSSSRNSSQPKSFTEYLAKNHTSPFRIGVLRYPFWNNTVLNSSQLLEQLPHYENMLKLLNSSNSLHLLDHVKVSDETLFTNISKESENIMIQHDFKHFFNEYLEHEVIYTFPPNASLITDDNPEIYRNSVTCLEELIEFYEEHPIPEGYNYEQLLDALATDGIMNATYIHARDGNQNAAKQFLDSVMEDYGLDAVVTPTFFELDGEMADKKLEQFPALALNLASMAGYPSMNIPAGIRPDGVPIGITLIGKPYSEHVLLSIANTIETISAQRQAPRYLL